MAGYELKVRHWLRFKQKIKTVFNKITHITSSNTARATSQSLPQVPNNSSVSVSAPLFEQIEHLTVPFPEGQKSREGLYHLPTAANAPLFEEIELFRVSTTEAQGDLQEVQENPSAVANASILEQIEHPRALSPEEQPSLQTDYSEQNSLSETEGAQATITNIHLGKESILLGNANSSTQPEFARFPDLPREIRNKIWAMAAMEPRKIIANTGAGDFRRRKVPAHYPGHSRHPAIMHATRESREEGKRFYKLFYEWWRVTAKTRAPKLFLQFPLMFYNRVSLAQRSNLVWINFAVDILVYLDIAPYPPLPLRRERINRVSFGYPNLRSHLAAPALFQYVEVAPRRSWSPRFILSALTSKVTTNGGNQAEGGQKRMVLKCLVHSWDKFVRHAELRSRERKQVEFFWSSDQGYEVVSEVWSEHRSAVFFRNRVLFIRKIDGSFITDG